MPELWLREQLGRGLRADRLASRCGFLLLLSGKQEVHPNLFAVDPREFATAIGKAGGRKQQEEFLEDKAINGTFNRKLGTTARYVVKSALATSCPIYGHHLRAIAAFKFHAVAVSLLSHCLPFN